MSRMFSEEEIEDIMNKIYSDIENEKKSQTRYERICSMSVEEMADKILASDISSSIDFCQEFSKCEELNEKGKEIPDEMCKKCLVKWLNSVEQQKTIPTEHFKERFSRVI